MTDASFLDDVLEGLSRRPRDLPCKYFYDAEGSALFERICRLDEYTLTRTELGLLEAHAAEMAALLGPECLLVEPGCGSGRKTELLLDHLERPAGYVALDISPEPLARFTEGLARRRPGLDVLALQEDYTGEFELPALRRRARRRAVFFPGSTIGNFHPGEVEGFLKRMARLCGAGGALLVGVDLPKDRATLERAYDDSLGVTAAFNRNLLARMRRELGAEVDVEGFMHRAVWHEALSRVEMHLVSVRPQRIVVGGRTFEIAEGESIRTECCYKWSLDAFQALAAATDWVVERVWTDAEARFSVQYLVVR
jgi:dimethylhistidine N-methyltransferase